MKRLAYFPYNFVVTFAVLLWTSICTLVAPTLAFVSRRTQCGFLRVWSRVCLKIMRVKIDVQGLEHIPTCGSIYLFNHQSLVDIIAVHAVIPVEICFGSKIELFKIPIWGFAMKLFGVIPIARDNRKEVSAVYEKSIARIHSGENLILAPEGTRNPDPGIKDFKSGPFIFAIQAQAPIVPIVMEGVRDILPKKAAMIQMQSHRRIRFRILNPFPTKGLSVDNRKEIKEKVRDIFIEEFNQLQNARNTQSQNY